MTDEEIAKLIENLEEAVVQLVFDEANHGAINLADSRVRSAVAAALAKASWSFECDDEEWGEV
jgi:hypothetical protein